MSRRVSRQLREPWVPDLYRQQQVPCLMGSGVVRQAQQELPDHQPVPRWVLAIGQQQLLQVQQADLCVQVCCRDNVTPGRGSHKISSLALEGRPARGSLAGSAVGHGRPTGLRHS